MAGLIKVLMSQIVMVFQQGPYAIMKKLGCWNVNVLQITLTECWMMLILKDWNRF